MGCISQSSVAVGPKETKKQRVAELTNQDNKSRRKGEEKVDEIKRRMLRAALQFPKLMRSKTLSQLFVHKGEIEEIEVEMEIGNPTDVKHVTHIGWDGSTSINPVMGWENLKAPELLSFPSISLKQFELTTTMSAQAEGVQDSTTISVL
ncbi:hypothetical protein LIER_42106 [Lithospermum erythrorhizon]|uniref:CRIB domain-containing protein n=1 Tax=Lithospermum erythrorhizon TaxID=34254 RepID=A0AAV3RLC9_LITER